MSLCVTPISSNMKLGNNKWLNSDVQAHQKYVATTGRYDMILGRDLLTVLGLDLIFSKNIILGGEGPKKGCSAPMVGVNNYEFNILTAKTVKLE